MIERMCLDDKVRLVFEVAPMPRPDTSHDVTWVRRHAGSGGSEENVLSFIEQRPAWHVAQSGRGPITVTIRLNVPHMYIAREVTAYTAAVRRLIQHEQGHVPAWERAMASSLQDMASELQSRIRTPTVTPQQVVTVVRSFIPQWALTCTQAADTWDATDYPRLHQDLARMGVPTFD
jgi:hypothetical protein